MDSKESSKIRTQLSKYSNSPVYFTKISYEGFKNEKNKTINHNDSYLVVTGIAKPAPIYEYLREQSITFDSITFGDHHNFSTKEIKQIAEKSNPYMGIITTEKYIDFKLEYVFWRIKIKLHSKNKSINYSNNL
jgi:tetraacyldisaccharide 4'-kinase